MSATSEAIKAIGRRVLVCGGRDYNNIEVICRMLDSCHAASPIECIISGMARGADTIGANWARSRGVPLAAYPADWGKHGTIAGLFRNKRMLDEGRPTLVLAFPGGRGTADMVRRAQRAKVPVIKIGE